MDFLDKQILAPKSWEKFEDLIQALFAEVWNDPVAKKHGRRGQPQHGVDVYGEPHGAGGPLHGVQCKGKDIGYGPHVKATIQEFDAELAKAEGFEPPLSHWTFATTAPDDAVLQAHVRNVSRARRAAGKFTVDVAGWGSLHFLLAKHPSVIRQFYPEHLPVEQDDWKLLTDASAQALQSIEDTLSHGDVSLSLIRAELSREASAAAKANPIVRLTGEGGSGKSGLVRRLTTGFSGPIVAIVDSRTTAKSLKAHLTELGIGSAPADLVEAAGGDGALLVIDGADRLLLSHRRGVVVDMLRCIGSSPNKDAWRIATTARHYQGRDLVADALKDAGFSDVGIQVQVTMAAEEDAEVIGSAFPAFARLLSRRDLAQQNRSLFIVRELLRRRLAPESAPTEMDAAGAWATLDLGDGDWTARRTKALSQLGRQLIADPWRRPPQADFDPVGLQLLVEEHSVVLLPNLDAVSLRHDVHEDWLVARALHNVRHRLPGELKSAGEPLWWLRAVRLCGQLLLEAGDIAGWVELLGALESAPDIDPAWARAVLVAPLYSERAEDILPRLEATLLENDARLLGRLLETLVVFETRIDARLLSSPVFEDMDETQRYRIAAHFKIPQLSSWIAFLRWSLPRWERWPASLIPQLSDVAAIWSRALRDTANWMSEEIAGIAARWLKEIEDASQWQRWEDRRVPFNTELERHHGWDVAAKTLRDVLVESVQSAPATVEAYLERAAGEPHLHKARTQLLETPGRVPALLPRAWVDMCVTQFVPKRPRVRAGPDRLIQPDFFAFYEMHDAGIRNDQGFFPSSPLRGGFADLFKADEEQALRLLHRLEMRASVVYRWFMRCNERRRPLPLTLQMPWGEYRLWGDAAVYRWSRGVLGSHVLGSAYLALDDWLHEQAAAGRPIEELLKLTVQNNGLVAIASPCIGLIAEHINSGDSIDFAGPFLAEPRLWDYDIRRHIDDRGIAHRIGFWSRDLHFDAAERIYQRHAARQPLHHSLLLPFRLKASSVAQDRFDERRARWSAADLAEYEAELTDAALVAEREERVARCISDSDPKQIQVEPVEGGLQVSIAPPKEAEEKIEAMTLHQRLLEDASRLANWVMRSREASEPDSRFSIEEAMGFASALAAELHTSEAPDEFGLIRRMAGTGIVGTAAIAANFAPPDLRQRHRDWIEEWLIAGALMHRAPEDEQITVNEAIIPDDPQVLGAWGLAALASRGLASAEADETVFGLAVQRLHAVTEAVVDGLAWDARPDFARGVHVAALDSCIIDVGHWWRGDDERRKAADRTARLRRRVVKRAMEGLASELVPLRPPPPFSMQWIRSGKHFWSVKRLKLRSKRVLDWGKAAAVLKRVDWARLADTPQRQAAYADYLGALANWTRTYAEEDTNRYDSQFPYEWGYALARETGRLAASCGNDSAWKQLTVFTERDRSEDLVSNYLDAVAHELMVSGREPDERFWSAWRGAAEWVMERTIPKKRGRHDDVSQALRAAGLVGPYLTPIPPDWPYLEQVLPWVDQWVERTVHLPAAAYSALDVAQRMTPEQRLHWFVPWLERWTRAAGADESYWSYYALGDKAAALLRPLPGSDAQVRHKVRQYLGVMADAGSIVARELMPSFATARPSG
jgi:hypothetical protein